MATDIADNLSMRNDRSRFASIQSREVPDITSDAQNIDYREGSSYVLNKMTLIRNTFILSVQFPFRKTFTGALRV